MIGHVLSLWGALAFGAPEIEDTVFLRPVAEFREEHETLLSRFSVFLTRATKPGATQLDRACLILYVRAEVLPHARAEETVLYPALEQALLTHGFATATMVTDHRNVSRLLDDMARLTGAVDPAEYNRRAYQLEAILRTHFAKEQQYIMALQERLSPADLDAVFARMRTVEHH
jgi:hypothetical protein